MVNRLSPALFKRKSTVDPVTGCWNWSGSLQSGGYGTLRSIMTPTCKGPSYLDRVDPARPRRADVGWLAHRASYVCHHGPIPRGLIVRHKCDNRLCVNPDHLELGTQADNFRDAVKRGHHSGGFPAGSQKKARQRKLTHADVGYILTSPDGDAAVAAVLGVTRSTISRIRTGHRKALVRPDLPRRL